LAEGCVFCAIAAGRAPAEIVYADAETMAFLDVAPLAPGHLLVIPRRHVTSLWDLPPELAGPLMGTTVRMAAAIAAAFHPGGVNLFHSTGADAGQSVFHVHLHVVPRWRGDRFRPPIVADRSPDPELAATAARLRAVLDAER
jgi:histidine triad (HIT) family protein